MPSLPPLKNRKNITAIFTALIINNQADIHLRANQKTVNKGIQ